MSVKARPRARAKGLGRGISALMEEDTTEETTGSSSPSTMPVADLKPGKFQPRHSFPEAELDELATSIKRNGLVQPIVIRSIDSGYEIVAGERRWRASQRAGLKEVPVIIRELDDKQTLEFALIENIQRQDLNPLEEAEGYQRLVDDFGYVQDELASTVGKSRSHVTNMMRLLSLPDEVKQLMASRELSMGHARALLKTDDPARLAQMVVSRGLNVRQTENLAKSGDEMTAANKDKLSSTPKAASNQTASPDQPEPLAKDDDTLALENSLSEMLSLPVLINNYDDKQGEVVIRFEGLSQLDGLLRKLTGVE